MIPGRKGMRIAEGRRYLAFACALFLCLFWISGLAPLSSDLEPSTPGPTGAAVAGTLASHTYYDVTLDGQSLGYTDDPPAVRQGLQDALDFRRLIDGYEVSLEESLEFEQITSSSLPELMTVGRIRARIEEVGTFVTHAVVIEVGGNEIGVVRDMVSAEALLDEIQREHLEAREGAEGVFVESVEILEEVVLRRHPVDPSVVRSPDLVRSILVRGTDKVVEHQVARGDTAWGIAKAAGLTVEELQKANPGSGDLSLLRPGDQVNLVVADPYITIRTEEVHTYPRYLPFPVETRSDSNLWPWERRVDQAGQRGEVEVVARIVRESNAEVEREVLSETRVSDPVTHIVTHGTKTIPQHGTGGFMVPAQGTLTSGFGYRGRGFHTGIDLAMPIGTPVRASDSGMVTTAGWQGAYGNTIWIDHGGGLVTVYAHLNGFGVSVGSVVERGAVIGYSGNTGRSTGPHLHFEIRENGTPRNPLNYFPK